MNTQSIKSPVWAVFASSSGNVGNTPQAMQLEFAGLNPAAPSLGARLFRVDELPAAADEINRLRPLRDVEKLLIDKRVELQAIKFYSLNVKSSGTSEGNPMITAATANAAIEDSLSSLNYAYAQARMRFGYMPGFQPNFFNPVLRFNDSGNYFDGLQNTLPDRGAVNPADLSVGLELPFYEHSYDPDRPLHVIEQFRSLEVFAANYQILRIPNDDNYYFQSYPVVCELKMVVVKE